MTIATQLAVMRLLDHSWKQINHEYDGLTETEKQLITPEEFDEVVEEINQLKLQMGNIS